MSKFNYQFNVKLISALQHKKLMRELLYMVGNVHKYETLPGHFQEGANRKYQYKRRTHKYLAQKKAKYGDRPDLVATGLMRANTLRNSQITATWDHWRLYAKKVAAHPIPGWMRDEIERINKNETSKYAGMISKGYKRLFSQYARKRAMK